MKSSFFYGNACEEVAEKIRAHINSVPDFLTSHTESSPRAVGDAIQLLVEESFPEIAAHWCVEYSAHQSRRAMADFAFQSTEGFFCVGDVKTHRLDADFSMPALVSIQRLTRFYEDDKNIFAVLMIKYTVNNKKVLVDKVIFCPIEFLDWKCLTIGALGWGQIQIANSNNIVINHGYSRRKWMLSLCDAADMFYPSEIAKIKDRMKRFDEIRAYWEAKPDIWE